LNHSGGHSFCIWQGQRSFQAAVDAIQEKSKGNFSLLSINKKEASTLLKSAGLQLPGGLFHNGFTYSIRESGSPVKPKLSDVHGNSIYKISSLR